VLQSPSRDTALLYRSPGRRPQPTYRLTRNAPFSLPLELKFSSMDKLAPYAKHRIQVANKSEMESIFAEAMSIVLAL